MAFVGLFLGGSPGALIASGQSVLNLQWQAENRQDTAGASFTVTGPGVSKTIPARADGRAEITVPVGTFTVSVTHKGAYLGDDPVQVVAESQKSYLVFFDGKVDRSAEINALDKRITDGDNALSKRIDGKLGKTETAVRATADGNGNNIPNTYAKKDELFSIGTVTTSVPVHTQDTANMFHGEKSITLPSNVKMISLVISSFDTGVAGGEGHGPTVSIQKKNSTSYTIHGTTQYNGGTIGVIVYYII